MPTFSCNIFYIATKIENLSTNVTAFMAGMNLPFIGVTGTSANNNIFDENSTTPATFPLSPNKNYVYKNSFPILPFYPLVHVTVTWALSSPANGNVVCFEYGATIVKK